MEKLFIAVVGNQGSGKSTIIKSLTGCPTGSHRDFVRDLETGESIYVVCSSPQEHPHRLQEDTELGLADIEELQALLDRVEQEENCRGVVMAIQPTAPRMRLGMRAIIREAMDRGFDVHVFVIDPGYHNDTGAWQAAQARLNGLHLDHEPTRLHGRRFAFFNAQRINEATTLIPEPDAVTA